MRLVLANLLAVFLLFAVFEGTVRWAYPEIDPLGTDSELVQGDVYGDVAGLRPNASGLSNGARFRVDANGHVRYAAARPDRPAWLLLGDSVTMGIGVDPDSTFAGRLAQLSHLNVLNPSLIGYGAADYRTVLAHHLGIPRPAGQEIKRVTVFWCLNDLYLPGSEEGFSGDRLRQIAGPLLRFAQRHLRSYQWLKQTLTDRPRAYFEHDRRLYETAALDSALVHLEAMKAMADERGIPFDVVLLPYEYQLRASSGHDALHPQRVMHRALAERGINVLDAASNLTESTNNPASLFAYGDGIHFSPKGHRAVAEMVDHWLPRD